MEAFAIYTLSFIPFISVIRSGRLMVVILTMLMSGPWVLMLLIPGWWEALLGALMEWGSGWLFVPALIIGLTIVLLTLVWGFFSLTHLVIYLLMTQCGPNWTHEDASILSLVLWGVYCFIAWWPAGKFDPIVPSVPAPVEVDQRCTRKRTWAEWEGGDGPIPLERLPAISMANGDIITFRSGKEEVIPAGSPRPAWLIDENGRSDETNLTMSSESTEDSEPTAASVPENPGRKVWLTFCWGFMVCVLIIGISICIKEGRWITSGVGGLFIAFGAPSLIKMMDKQF